MFIDACNALGKITKSLEAVLLLRFVGFFDVRKVKVSNFIPYFYFFAFWSLNVDVSILLGSI